MAALDQTAINRVYRSRQFISQRQRSKQNGHEEGPLLSLFFPPLSDFQKLRRFSPLFPLLLLEFDSDESAEPRLAAFDSSSSPASSCSIIASRSRASCFWRSQCRRVAASRPVPPRGIPFQSTIGTAMVYKI